MKSLNFKDFPSTFLDLFFELLVDQKVLRAKKYLKCSRELAIKPQRDLDWVSVCSPLSTLEDGRQYFFRTDSIQYIYIGRVIITHIRIQPDLQSIWTSLDFHGQLNNFHKYSDSNSEGGLSFIM